MDMIATDLVPNTANDVEIEGRTRYKKSMIAFTMLKAKIARTPILKHHESDLSPVVIVYGIKWAVSKAFMQSYDGVHWPMTFASRTRKLVGVDRSVGSPPDPRFMLHNAGNKIGQGFDPLFDHWPGCFKRPDSTGG